MTEISGDLGRRPLDVFDSTADGFAPHTLEQTVQAALSVVQALEQFDAALKGCGTPLELGRLAAQGRAAREKAEAWLEELSEARDIIELDLPISDTFRQEIIEGWEEEPPEPWTRDGGPETLTPKAIIGLRGDAAALPIGRLTSYRQQIEKGNTVPPLVRRHRDREIFKAWRMSLTEEEHAVLKSEGRVARMRSYRDFRLAASSAVPNLVEH